jgi:hypothetical protein
MIDNWSSELVATPFGTITQVSGDILHNNITCRSDACKNYTGILGLKSCGGGVFFNCLMAIIYLIGVEKNLAQ